MSSSTEAGAFVLPTGTVAFLLTDVEGSTRLWEDQPEAMASAMERHAAILDAAVSARSGVCPPAQGEGDSVVAAFARASDAVLAALEAQRLLVAESWPTSEPLRVRMAVHAGEARTATDGNYAGQAIIRTARLRAVAYGGQVLVSAPARDLTVDHLGDRVRLVDLGQHRLRDLARPEHVYELAGPGLLEGFGPLRSLDTHPNNLPLQLSTFIGRVEEIATVSALVRENRLVTITGAGGAGKTRLAQQVAAEVIDRTADGTWWVELADVSDPALVNAAIATTVGSKGHVGEHAADALATVLADRDALIVLDNCEHVVEVVAATVDRLLRRCPAVRVLATSREPLDVAGEVAWRIPPLGLPAPAATPAPVSTLPQSDSVRLFLDRAQRVRPNFHLTDDNGPIVAGICEHLDGIPLAIELAAARCRSLTVDQISDGLGDAFRLLTGGRRAALARQATLDASLTWSHDLLSEDEQALFRRLAVFNGGCTLDDVEHVVAGEPLSAPAVLDLLDRLVAQSLVQVDDGATTARYRLLAIVRQYASRRLEQSGEADRTRVRHAKHFMARTAALTPDYGASHDVAVQRWIAQEFDNLLAALATLAEADQWDDYATIALPVAGLCWFVAPATGLALLDRCLAANALTLPNVVALVTMARAAQRQMMGDLEGGFADALAALDGAEARGDHFVTSWAKLGFALGVGQMRPQDADPLFETALVDARRSGSKWLEAMTSQLWASIVVMWRGETAVAEAIVADADRIWSEYGRFTTGSAYLDAISALLSWQRGELDAADARLQHGEATIAAAAQLGANTGAITGLSYIGATVAYARTVVALARGERPPILDTLHRSAEIARREGLAASEAIAWMSATLGLLAAGDAQGVLAAHARSLSVELDTAPMDVMHVHAGIAHLALGNIDSAQELAVRARDKASMFGCLLVGAEAELLLGWVQVAGRDTAAAAETAHAALLIATEQRYRLIGIRGLELLATIAATDDDMLETARLSGAIERARDERGFRMRVVGLSDRFDDAVAAARTALTDDGFAVAAAEGAQLDLDATIAYVGRTRGERKRPTLGWASLTPTETRVVESVAAGLTNPQIAKELLMSRETVKSHVSHIFSKLGVDNRAALAALAGSRSRDEPHD